MNPCLSESRASKLKQKLAKMIEMTMLDTFNKHVIVNPENLKRNRGANKFNDWCSWDCDSHGYHYCSWEPMSELARRGEISILYDANGIYEIV